MKYFDTTSIHEAAAAARRFLASVTRCSRCLHVISLLHERLGSTLFRDDDPKILAGAFDARDRHECTLRLLAACIILFGRCRVGVGTAHEQKRQPGDGVAPTEKLAILVWSDGSGVTVSCPALPGTSVHSDSRSAALRELRRIVWRRVDRGELPVPPRIVFEPFELPANTPMARLASRSKTRR